MKRILLGGLLALPFLAYADPLAAIAYGNLLLQLLNLFCLALAGVLVLVSLKWPQWRGLPVVQGLALLLYGWLALGVGSLGDDFWSPWPGFLLTALLLILTLSRQARTALPSWVAFVAVMAAGAGLLGYLLFFPW